MTPSDHVQKIPIDCGFIARDVKRTARRVSHYSFATALAVAAALNACESPVTPGPLPPLTAAVWHVHVADGQLLPALVAHGTVDGALDQTFLDSAQLSVTAGGRWELRSHLQRFRAGEFEGYVGRLDAGAWAATDSGYLFTSDVFGARFVLREPPGDTTAVGLKVEAVPGVIVAALRRVPPPATPAGFWHAGTLHGLPLPGAIYVFDPYKENGRLMSIHLVVDSVVLALHPTGRYRHRTWYTEWEGDPGGSWHTVRFRWALNDFGVWARAGDALQLESEWLQNHRMTGSFIAAGRALEMQHGLSHGDPPVAFGYRR